MALQSPPPTVGVGAIEPVASAPSFEKGVHQFHRNQPVLLKPTWHLIY